MRSIANFKISILCLICGLSSLLCLLMIFDVLELVTQNLVLIALVLLIVINISVSLGFLFVSNYSSAFEEVASVFSGTVFVCASFLNIACILTIGVFVGQILRHDYDKSFLESLQLGYGSPFHSRTTGAWDSIHTNWKCCGLIDSDQEWRQARWFLSQRKFPRNIVPNSCLNPLTSERFDNGCLLEIRRHVLLSGLLAIFCTLMCIYIQIQSAIKMFARSFKYELQQDSNSPSIV